MDSSNLSREEAKRATREALVEAAEAEFFVNGFDGPSLDAICARAGYTRGAFYVHFRNRDELIAAVMEHALHMFLDEVIANAGGERDIETTVERFVSVGLTSDPETGGPLGPAIRQILDACHRSDDVRKSFLGALGEAGKRLVTGVLAGQSLGRLRNDVPAAEMSNLLVLLALGSRTAEELGLDLDLERTKDAALRMLLSQG
jgi:TetR/AcrR family transcriptional repressor of nem operon